LIGGPEDDESESTGGPDCRLFDGLGGAVRGGLDPGPLRDLSQGLGQAGKKDAADAKWSDLKASVLDGIERVKSRFS
jgi:hypothetical protein